MGQNLHIFYFSVTNTTSHRKASQTSQIASPAFQGTIIFKNFRGLRPLDPTRGSTPEPSCFIAQIALRALKFTLKIYPFVTFQDNQNQSSDGLSDFSDSFSCVLGTLNFQKISGASPLDSHQWLLSRTQLSYCLDCSQSLKLDPFFQKLPIFTFLRRLPTNSHNLYITLSFVAIILL